MSRYAIEFEGVTYSSRKELCEVFGVNYAMFQTRINQHGFSIADALRKPKQFSHDPEEQKRTGKKRCSACKKAKPLAEFSKNKNHRDGLNYRCFACKRTGARKYLYGVTQQQYDHYLKQQGGGCKLCGTKKPGGNGKAFHVDHCHKTNVVRGLLCVNCNVALGKFKDDPEVLRLAATYVETMGFNL